MFRNRRPKKPIKKHSDINVDDSAEIGTVLHVTVPGNVNPGDEFTLRVRCPPDWSPGETLRLSAMPAQKGNSNNEGGSFDSGSTGSSTATSDSCGKPPSPCIPNPPPATHRPHSSLSNDRNTYMVTIPEGVLPGALFPVKVRGQKTVTMVTCPSGASAGTQVRITMPPPTRQPDEESPPAPTPAPQNNDGMVLYEVKVPRGVRPGAPFPLVAGGARILVTCPMNAVPGQRIRFKVPKEVRMQSSFKDRSAVAQTRLSYDKDGWTRTLRLSDLRFQWVRVDSQGQFETNHRFNTKNSAYVRKLEFLSRGHDPFLRTGRISLVAASEGVVDSSIKNARGKKLVSYKDIAAAQSKPFEEKAKWFQATCNQLRMDWDEGHMQINVRRDCLLADSINAVMSLSRTDLRKLWRFSFIGEIGIDAGGVARDWFHQVTKKIFDPDLGLWQSSAVNQMSMQVNPASAFCYEEHLDYFRFLGRVMGKALFDGDNRLCSGHMVQHMYKHLLGWPVTFADLERVDEEYYNSLKELERMVANGEDLSLLYQTFSVTTDVFGKKEEIELIPGGSDIELNNDNFPEYLEACLKYKLLDVVKPQLNELLLGFFDVIPEPLLTVFDFQELELLICGMPEIDMRDWKANTEYSGAYEDKPSHPACIWFWEVVSDFDHEMKARLLQFVTGTSGVSARGFGVLPGVDGNIRKFTIHGVPLGDCLYPRAHTCFNRIDLPMYHSKNDLEEKLKVAVTMAGTVFSIE